ncbi:MAG: methyltransferase, CheR-type [Alphaproteobacteria bacterium]|nr:methyltransferase, CheR-type [Alphaproteobacteria bacterium]
MNKQQYFRDGHTVLEDARHFTQFLADLERQLRKTGSTSPPLEAKQAVAQGFWNVFDAARKAERLISPDILPDIKERFRTILMPWLCKSRNHGRAIVKPQGYSGDFMVIEYMYEMEHDPCDNPHQAAIVNCLDYAFNSIDSVQSVWERRRWLAGIANAELARRPDLRILDVACGGARYLRDALSCAAGAEQALITLVDQDPAALNYARDVSLLQYAAQIETICVPIKSLSPVLNGRKFDLIICSGLFDYLGDMEAAFLLHGLASALEVGGMLAITNFHPQDRSAAIKDWGADWQIVFRNEQQVRQLFVPTQLDPAVHVSANGSLVMAAARRNAS